MIDPRIFKIELREGRERTIKSYVLRSNVLDEKGEKVLEEGERFLRVTLSFDDDERAYYYTRISDGSNWNMNRCMAYIKNFFEKGAIEYGMENGRFLRTFAVPNDSDYTEEQIGNAISHYIATFDEMLKNYLAGRYESTQDIEKRYLQYLNSGVQLI